MTRREQIKETATKAEKTKLWFPPPESTLEYKLNTATSLAIYSQKLVAIYSQIYPLSVASKHWSWESIWHILNPLEMDQPWKGTIRRCSTYIMHNLTCIHYCEISIYIPLQCLMLLLRNIMYLCIPVCTHVYIYEITCWQSTLFMRTQSHSIFYFIHFINGINGQWNLHFGFGLYIR